MRAAILHARGRDGVSVRDIPPLECPDGSARVRMLAGSVNRVDLYMRDNGKGITHELPQILGLDGVGEVTEAPSYSAFRKGDRVVIYPYEFCGICRQCLLGNQPLCYAPRILGETRHGTLCEEVVVSAKSLAKVSSDSSVDEAAVLGCAYLTAWRMVFGRAPAAPGRIVLVQGGGGGVSYAAVQLARMAGARVIVTTTGEDKLAHFRQLGVDVIDYVSEDVPKAVLRLTDGEGADLVIDNVGEKTWKSSLRSLAHGGDLVTCGATTGSHPSADIQRLFTRQLSIHGTTLGDMDELRRLVSVWEAGALKPLIDSTFSLDEVPAALDRLEHPDRIGKVLIRIS